MEIHEAMHKNKNLKREFANIFEPIDYELKWENRKCNWTNKLKTIVWLL